VDATLLAAAGLERLGLSDVGVALPITSMLPAPSQGVVGVEVRGDDASAYRLVRGINHADTLLCVLAERALLSVLRADCRSPVAALASCDVGAGLRLRAQLFDENGTTSVDGTCSGIDPVAVADGLANSLLARAPPAITELFGG
jgi:hydroxymethylbilane synthase